MTDLTTALTAATQHRVTDDDKGICAERTVGAEL